MAPRFKRAVPVLMVRDVGASLRFYLDGLGFVLRFQDAPANPQYAVLARDAILLHLQWNDFRGWSEDADRPIIRIEVEDVDSLRGELDQRGVALRDLGETPWHTREFHVRDPDRNGLQFFSPLGS